MKIWIVSMECAGIVEAGGVKDVTYALCENFAKEGNDVTLFIPVFAANSFSSLKNIQEHSFKADISLCGQTVQADYTTAQFIDFPGKVVLVNHPAFSEKQAVYVYTAEEQQLNPSHVCGTGHSDAHFLDALLSKAAVSYGAAVSAKDLPDVIHCQDAATAVTPCYAALMQPAYFEKTTCFVTIHNAGPAYHHEFCNIDEAYYYTELPWNWLMDAMNGVRVEPFLLASKNAVLTTVSTYYATELLNPANNDATDGLSGIFAARKIPVFGITNGIDYCHYSPECPEISGLPFPMETDSAELEGKYRNRDFFLRLCEKDISDEDKNCAYMEHLFRYGYLSSCDKGGAPCVYFVYHGRIVWQKGISLLLQVMNAVLREYDNVRFIIMGQGETAIENEVQGLTDLFAGKAVFFKGYNGHMSRLCVAAADFSVLPSYFEPCCLEDFISQIFGTVPVAHETGGLRKIIDGETGFLYPQNTFESLYAALEKAVDLRLNHFNTMKKMVRWASHFVKDSYSWEFVIRNKYLKLFEKNMKKRKKPVDTFSRLV